VPFGSNNRKAIRRKDANTVLGRYSKNERAQISGFRIIAPAGIGAANQCREERGNQYREEKAQHGHPKTVLRQAAPMQPAG